MPTVPCPSCRQPLNLPESLRGSAVRCPHCQTVFTAPSEAPSPVQRQPAPHPRRAPAAEAPPPAPATQGPAQDFAFEEGDEDRSRGRVRMGRKTRGPANTMRTSAILEFVMSLCCFAGAVFGGFGGAIAGEHAAAFAVVAILTVVGIINIGLGVVVLLGAQSLANQKGYGLAIAAAIIDLLLGIKSLLVTGWFGLGLISLIPALGHAPGALLAPCGLFSVALAAAITGLSGGIRALMALTDDQVKQAFR